MTPQHPICIFFSRAILSVLLYIGSTAAAQAQQKTFVVEKDSIPFFNGMQLSFDLVGPAMRAIGSTGEIEGALRFNLHDQYYPIVELGYGMANHNGIDLQDTGTLFPYRMRHQPTEKQALCQQVLRRCALCLYLLQRGHLAHRHHRPRMGRQHLVCH